MSNILLVEPSYRSKFPPLGLMRISSYYKSIGDSVTFVKGRVQKIRDVSWHRVYVSSLFTYELPRTVATIKYYSKSVADPKNDIIVGGIGATLIPEYITNNVDCRVIVGPLDKPNILEPNSPSISNMIPDYDIVNSVEWNYQPTDSYFCRATIGCIRKCSFCAVPILEPTFDYSCSIKEQIEEVDQKFGQRQHLVLLDNNLLATKFLEKIIKEIEEQGFQTGAIRNNRQRTVDFNQGIDARLITPKIAKLLSSICLKPIRLAFDFEGMEPQYRYAMDCLLTNGFKSFTNYVLYNFNDTPKSLYNRLRINVELSKMNSILLTSFPMRYIPIHDINRKYISEGWTWRYLRGIQCIMNATHGMVSPNIVFFEKALGSNYEEFIEIISMPDHYIINRAKHENDGAADWRLKYRKLSSSKKEELMSILASIHKSENRKITLSTYKEYSPILEHYYPNGEAPCE